VDYQLTGQPVLIGGTMGTCSYVLTGTEQGMQVHTTFSLMEPALHHSIGSGKVDPATDLDLLPYQ
jgi:hypothetical protein